MENFCEVKMEEVPLTKFEEVPHIKMEAVPLIRMQELSHIKMEEAPHFNKMESFSHLKMEDKDLSFRDNMESDLVKVCRLCLKGNEVLVPIFVGQQNGAGTSLPHRIMACAQVKVAEGDGLPPNVCTSCLSQVDRSYQFKLLCERSDSALRGEMYVKNESPSDEECSDNGEGWDMTKFTPEVIIKEETDENSLSMNGGGEDVGGYYGSLHAGHVSASALHSGHIQNSHLPTTTLHGGESDTLTVRMSQPSAVDLRTTGDGLMLNGLVFPLPSALSHLPPPGPSSNRSRRCRSGDKLFKCRQCNKSYSFSSALSRHKAVHNTALRPHVCQICKKGFTDMDKLMRHEKTHTMDILMTCDLCHRPFRSFSAFQKHRATGVCMDVPEEENDQSSGPHSPSQSSPDSSSQQPSQTPPQQQPPAPPPAPPPPPPAPPTPTRGRDSGKGKPEFKCPVCLKLFATRGSLDVHSTIHTGVRPFVCSVCHKSFRHKVNLMEHFQRKHSQVRPYICDVCAARFVTKQELVRHYRKHIGD